MYESCMQACTLALVFLVTVERASGGPEESRTKGLWSKIVLEPVLNRSAPHGLSAFSLTILVNSIHTSVQMTAELSHVSIETKLVADLLYLRESARRNNAVASDLPHPAAGAVQTLPSHILVGGVGSVEGAVKGCGQHTVGMVNVALVHITECLWLQIKHLVAFSTGHPCRVEEFQTLSPTFTSVAESILCDCPYRFKIIADEIYFFVIVSTLPLHGNGLSVEERKSE